MQPSQPNQSLIDGLACLQALAAHREPIGSRELGRLLGLERTRVNRLLKTLTYIGLAEQDANSKYRPGPAIHVLAVQSLFGSGLLHRAFGPLEELLKLGHIVAMGVLWRDLTCYLYHANPKRTVAHGVGHPKLYPAATSGLGMALLAHRPEPEVRALYTQSDRRTPWSASLEPPVLEGPDGLLTQLAQVRVQGYALVPIPHTPDRTASITMGAPPNVAIGLSGAFPDDDIPAIVSALRNAAEQIEKSEEFPGEPTQRAL